MARTAKEPWFWEERGTWHVWIDGKRSGILARGKRGRKAAVQAFHRLMADREAARNKPPGITLKVLCELFTEHLEREKSPVHATTTRDRLRKFARHLGGNTNAPDVRPHHVTAWLASTSWGPTTRHGYITTLKSMFNWAKREGLLESNPLADMQKPTPKTREEIMDAGQVYRLLCAVKDQAFRDFLTALKETGMRPSEAMRLEAHMIDFDQGVIATKGKGRDRVVYLNDTALELLRRLAKKWPAGPLLRNLRGKPWTRNATALRFNRLRTITPLGLAGPEVTAESFRHAFATDGLERGVPIATMAELLGHKSTKMIEKHYSKLRQRREHLAEAVRKVRPGEAEVRDKVERGLKAVDDGRTVPQKEAEKRVKRWTDPSPTGT